MTTENRQLLSQQSENSEKKTHTIWKNCCRNHRSFHGFSFDFKEFKHLLCGSQCFMSSPELCQDLVLFCIVSNMSQGYYNTSLQSTCFKVNVPYISY